LSLLKSFHLFIGNTKRLLTSLWMVSHYIPFLGQDPFFQLIFHACSLWL